MANTGTVWAFDLGKGSIGEAVRSGNKFLHKASLPCQTVAKRKGRFVRAHFAEKKKGRAKRPCMEVIVHLAAGGSALPNLSWPLDWF